MLLKTHRSGELYYFDDLAQFKKYLDYNLNNDKVEDFTNASEAQHIQFLKDSAASCMTEVEARVKWAESRKAHLLELANSNIQLWNDEGYPSAAALWENFATCVDAWDCKASEPQPVKPTQRQEMLAALGDMS